MSLHNAGLSADPGVGKELERRGSDGGSRVTAVGHELFEGGNGQWLGKGYPLPQPSNQVRRWLDLAQVPLPQMIQRKALQVATQQKLQNHRPRRSK